MPLFEDYIAAMMTGEPVPDPRTPSFTRAPEAPEEDTLPGTEYPGQQPPVEQLPGDDQPPVYQEAPPAEVPAEEWPEGAVPYEPAQGEAIPGTITYSWIPTGYVTLKVVT